MLTFITVNLVKDDGDFDCGHGDERKCPNWRDIYVDGWIQWDYD